MKLKKKGVWLQICKLYWHKGQKIKFSDKLWEMLSEKKKKKGALLLHPRAFKSSQGIYTYSS